MRGTTRSRSPYGSAQLPIQICRGAFGSDGQHILCSGQSPSVSHVLQHSPSDLKDTCPFGHGFSGNGFEHTNVLPVTNMQICPPGQSLSTWHGFGVTSSVSSSIGTARSRPAASPTARARRAPSRRTSSASRTPRRPPSPSLPHALAPFHASSPNPADSSHARSGAPRSLSFTRE